MKPRMVTTTYKKLQGKKKTNSNKLFVCFLSFIFFFIWNLTIKEPEKESFTNSRILNNMWL